MKLRLIILLVFFAFILRAGAQTPDSALNTSIRVWNKYTSNRTPDLYLHLDKSLYLTNENIFFTSYLVGGGGDTTSHNILYVLLVNLATRKVVTTDRFIMYKSVSSGSLLVPDTLDVGEYLFVAYTDAMRDGSPDRFFRKQISVRSKTKPPFEMAVSVLPQGLKDDSIRLKCRVTTDYGGLAIGGEFNYSLLADGQLLQSGKKIINAFGETEVALPAKDTLAKTIALNCEVKRNKNSMTFREPVILRPGQVTVTYYPEGGNLIDGHVTRIAIELRKKNGAGISTNKGVFIEDGKEIAGFSTDTYGFGALYCRVHKGKKYEVRCEDMPVDNYIYGSFPDIVSRGFTMNILNGVPQDLLTIKLQAPAPGSKCNMMVYCDNAILYAGIITLKSDSGTINLPVADWPRGLATVSLFGEDGTLLAERTIFIPEPKISVSIQTDSLIYHTRSMVQLHVKITDKLGKPVPGMFSFASVLSARAGLKNFMDIGRFADFGRYLAITGDALPPANYFNNDASMDLMLLTRLQLQSHWNKMKQDTLRSGVDIDDYGYVLHNNKKVRQPVPLLLLGFSTYKFETDSSGHFQIPGNALTAPLGENPIVSVVDKKNADLYKIILKNHYDTVNSYCAAAWYTPATLSEDTSFKEKEEVSTAFNEVKTLQRVVITSGDNEDSYNNNGCRDWVCQFNVLNCPNHPYGRRPKIGETYDYRFSQLSGPAHKVVYKGCISCKGCDNSITFVGKVRAIHLNKEYYNTDSIRFSATEPVLLSTLYWAPLIQTNESGEATVRFYTDDLKGRFYNIVQGVSATGVFEGKEVFSVVE